MKIFNVFKRTGKNRIKILNNKCEKLLSSIFFNCRLYFGREFTDIKNLKNELLKNIDNGNFIQKKIVVNILELIIMYFNLIKMYVYTKNSDTKNDFLYINDRMEEVSKYIYELNSQFYLLSDGVLSNEASDLMNEAKVLKNVIESNYMYVKLKKKILLNQKI